MLGFGDSTQPTFFITLYWCIGVGSHHRLLGFNQTLVLSQLPMRNLLLWLIGSDARFRPWNARLTAERDAVSLHRNFMLVFATTS